MTQREQEAKDEEKYKGARGVRVSNRGAGKMASEKRVCMKEP